MLVSGVCFLESELICFWSLWLYSLCLLTLYQSWISNWSFHAEFTSLLPPPPFFPLLVPGNLWDGYVVSVVLFSATSGFLRGDFFFLRISFGSPLHPILWLPQWLQEEGWSSHLTTQCPLGCAAAAGGKDALGRCWFSSCVWAVTASLFWHGERVFPTENTATAQSSDIAVQGQGTLTCKSTKTRSLWPVFCIAPVPFWSNPGLSSGLFYYFISQQVCAGTVLGCIVLWKGEYKGGLTQD